MKLPPKVFLLADDDEDDTHLFCEALTVVDPSIVCHKAEDGRDAIRLLSDDLISKPDIIFLDINMPVMNGWQCLVKLKSDSRHRDIPVIIYSTSSHQRDMKIALDLGAVCFITKPDSFKDLKTIVSLIASTPLDSLSEAISGIKNSSCRPRATVR